MFRRASGSGNPARVYPSPGAEPPLADEDPASRHEEDSLLVEPGGVSISVHVVTAAKHGGSKAPASDVWSQHEEGQGLPQDGAQCGSSSTSSRSSGSNSQGAPPAAQQRLAAEVRRPSKASPLAALEVGAGDPGGGTIKAQHGPPAAAPHWGAGASSVGVRRRGLSFVEPLPGNGGAGPPPGRTSIFSAASAGGASARSSSVFDGLEQEKLEEFRRPRWKQVTLRVIDSTYWTLGTCLLVFLVLYADALRAAVAPPSADKLFEGFVIFCISFFSLEIIALSLVKPKYFLRFYFWVDLISTAVLLVGIPAIPASILNLETGTGPAQASAHQRRRVQHLGVPDGTMLCAMTTLEEAAEGGSVKHTRSIEAAQTARVVRLLQLIRIYRLWHEQRRRLKKESLEGEWEAEQARVKGVQAVQRTRVVIGILLLLFCFPVFDIAVGYWGAPPSVDEQARYHLPARAQQHDPVLDERLLAILDMARTTFIILMLVVGALLFIRDNDRLVLEPLERMVRKVKLVSENPLAKHRVDKAETRAQKLQARLSITLARGGRAGEAHGGGDPQQGRAMLLQSISLQAAKQLETSILENSLNKICSLLSVGFGEAGAEVIANNIRSTGDLNPMVAGQRVAAIYGFCDIRAFTDATEVLQEEVMEFVNSIAKIVHVEVALHGGAANKNIGDAFLLVWKLPGLSSKRGSVISTRASRVSVASMRNSMAQQQQQQQSPPPAPAQQQQQQSPPSLVQQGQDEVRPSGASAASFSVPTFGASPMARGSAALQDEIQAIADAALASFVIIQSALKRSHRLQAYAEREDLNERLPGFQVRMGFGLHVGWSIEGAIGSEHKIDASYLSPHVNMASRLEAATKQFGTSILLSVKGSTHPVGLFTYDVCAEGMEDWPARLAALTPVPIPRPLTPTRSIAHLLSLPSAHPPPAKHHHQQPSSPTPAKPLGSLGGLLALPGLRTGSSSSPPPVPPSDMPRTDSDVAMAAAAAHAAGVAAAVSAKSHHTFSNRPYLDEFSDHPDIRLVKAVDPAFLARFAEGFSAYREGDWDRAQGVLEECLTLRRGHSGQPVEDGPSATLLRRGLRGAARCARGERRCALRRRAACWEQTACMELL
eukprot:scaffold9.g3219.t1